MKKVVFFAVLIAVFLFSASLSLVYAVSADYAKPQITEKPLVLVPGEQLSVSIYNGGHDIWTDIVLCVRPLATPTSSELFCSASPALLSPESFADVPLDVPLSLFLSVDEIEASIYYNNELLDARVLPVRLIMPSATVFADDNFYVFFDPLSFNLSVKSLLVEVSVLDVHNHLVYIDVLGPFYIEGDAPVIKSLSLPDYLPLGELTLQSRFFSDGHMLEESFTTFTHVNTTSSLPVNAIFLMFVLIVFLVLAYVVLDMTYHKHQLEDVINRLRK